jgi:hypothetical protein
MLQKQNQQKAKLLKKLNHYKIYNKKKNLDLIEDYIELRGLIRILLQEKFLFIFFTIVFSLLVYLYSYYKNINNKEFYAEIKINKLNKSFLYDYKVDTHPINDLQNLLQKNFLSNMYDSKNLDEFVQKSSEIDNFKAFLKSRRQGASQYFAKNRFGLLKENDEITEYNRIFLIFPKELDEEFTEYYKFFLIFPKELDGVNFLNNYGKYIENKTIGNMKNDLRLKIEKEIYEYERAIEFIKKELSNITTYDADKNLEVFIVLTKAINFKKEKIKKLENEINVNLIGEASYSESYNNNYQLSLFYILKGLIFSFFISFVIIYLKNNLKKTN